MIEAFARLLRKFRRDKSGNIAITFGLAALPIMLAVGAAVDYTVANRTKAALDGYADAAAISAVNQAAMALTNNQAKTFATNQFNAQAAMLKKGSVSKVTVKVTTTGNTRTAVLTYTASVPTAFMGMVNVNTIPVAGSSTASSAAPTYIDFYLLLDNTPSMGVGATPADVTKMVNNTPARWSTTRRTNAPSPAISSMSRQTIITVWQNHSASLRASTSCAAPPSSSWIPRLRARSCPANFAWGSTASALPRLQPA
jgi:Flp pilus assembly protein TadG